MPRRLAERGAGVVYTRDWVADLMLDLVGYTVDEDLGAETIVEPGCGDGAFLRRIIPRLIASADANGRRPISLIRSIRAYELDGRAASLARGAVIETLVALRVPVTVAQQLADSWIIQSDFLLERTEAKVRWVVGNPPYVRVEETDPTIYAEYRKRWTTMAGRADVYIGFYEAALSLLQPGGQLCFICADRWMHNQYGASLRRHVIEDFAVRAVVEVHDADVFDVPVAAYPAITVIQRAAHTPTALATASAAFDAAAAARFVSWWNSPGHADHTDENFSASVLAGQFKSDASWPSGPPERLRLIADLESRLPTLSDVGVQVRVGMATGADKVYVVSDPGDVERQFVKKAIGPADIRDGAIVWGGRYIISPWDEDRLAEIEAFPGLHAYFEHHRATLEARYVGKRNPTSWWRTIDRPSADQYREPKLVVADINDRIEPALDVSGRWPMHSAYYLTSDRWDLEALGGYLLSDVAGAFIEAYSVKMANGHLRVSGQYLKKIRLPQYDDISLDARNALQQAFRARDRISASLTVRNLVLFD